MDLSTAVRIGAAAFGLIIAGVIVMRRKRSA